MPHTLNIAPINITILFGVHNYWICAVCRWLHNLQIFMCTSQCMLISCTMHADSAIAHNIYNYRHCYA